MTPTLTWTRSRPVALEDPADELADEVPDDDLPPISTSAAQVQSSLATRATTAVLLLCVGLGPVGAVLGWLAWAADSSTTSAAPPPASADHSREQAIAGQFAQQVVATWLATTTDNPDPLLALVPIATVPSGVSEPFGVTDLAVANIEAVGPDWAVTVAATVTDARKIQARRFYQVPVTVDGTTVTALTLPTPVTGPTPTRPAGDAYRDHVAESTPVGAAVTDFLTAYLTAADVSRYLTPGVTITPPTPAAFTTVRVDELRTATPHVDLSTAADGEQILLMATATASVSDRQASAVSFALTLTARAGRWEITAIDPAPAAPPPVTPPTPAGGPTPAGSPSTG